MAVNIQRSRPIISDPNIIPRVRKYLEEHVDQTYVDVGVMAKELQDKYTEYTRRKTVPFRILVEQAYKLVLRSYGLDSNPSSDNENDSDGDIELMEENQNKSNNHMNDTMSSLYMSKNKNMAGNDELIDISSDDDDDEQPARSSDSGTNKANGSAPVAATATKDDQQPRSGSAIVKFPSKAAEKLTQQHRQPAVTGQGMGEITITQQPVATSGKKAASPIEVAQAAKKRKTDELPTMNNSVSITTLRSGGQQAGQAMQAQLATGSSKPKRYKKEVKCVNVSTTFDDIGGMDKTLTELCELLVHVKHPAIYRTIGLPPPRGFLLHGPPGCGKTLLANAIAGTLDIPLISIPATELVGGLSGESEERIREVFEQAAALAPCVLFIDEIDVISSNRQNASKDMERRIVSQLLGSMDALAEHPNGGGVIVIGATNRPDAIDPSLRRVGRFDHEISLGIPDRKARYQILQMICYDLKLEHPFDFDKLATLTPGYVGADLLALAQRSASTAIKRVFAKKEQKELEAQEIRKAMLTKSTAERLAIAAISGEVVNLTEESVIMDMDDEEVSSSEKTKATENPVFNGDTAKEAVEEQEKVETTTEEKLEEVKETVGDEQSITTTTTAEVNGAEMPKESETTSIPTTTTSTTSDEQMDTSETDAPKEPTPVQSAEEVQSANTPAEQNPTVEPVIEEPPAPTEEIKPDGTNSTAAAPEVTPVVTAPIEDVPMPDSELPEPEKPLKTTLTLECMMQWLMNDVAVLTEEELKSLYITMNDFVEALKHVQPSAKREGFITIPDVTWKDIGSLQDIRDELKLAVLAPVRFPDKLEKLGLQSPSGVLLCGPPGCGKTLLAKAIANEAGINFISVKGPELLNMYVGESERAVRQVFQRARNSAPCVIFFDEFDALCPKRSDTAEGGGSQRVVNQLLTEMDGVEERKGVFLMAATNRPDIVDPAVLRPGRLDKILYVGLPDEADRVDILRAVTKNATKPPLSEDVDLNELAAATSGFTGADLAGLVRQAALQTLKSSISGVVDLDMEEEQLVVKKEHIMEALANVRPSVSDEDIKHYEKLKRKYGTTKKEKV